MNECVYSTLRAEATSGFASVRQLVVGEYAAFAIVLVELLKTKSPYAVVALEIIVVGIVYFAARSGRDWYIQAIRQMAYLLVMYELPELVRREAAQDPDRFALWVLANRSESHFHSHTRDYGRQASHPQTMFRTHTPGRELHTFLVHQFWLMMIGFAAAIVVFLRSLPGITTALLFHQHVTVAEQRKELGILLSDMPLIVIAIVVTGVFVWFLFREIRKADEALHRLTVNWIEYNADRSDNDNQFLRTKDYVLKHPLAP